jgi:hypothetical protein
MRRFARLLYFSYLGRVPTVSGVCGQINGGLGRTDMAMAFLNTPEFNFNGRFVAGLYIGLLNRDAEFSGWQFQRNAVASGNGKVTQTQLVENFISSAEYRLKFGTPSDGEYVRLLSRYILLREPSPAEVGLQVAELARVVLQRLSAAR